MENLIGEVNVLSKNGQRSLMSEYASRFDFLFARVSKLPNFSLFFFFFQTIGKWKIRDKHGMDGKFDWNWLMDYRKGGIVNERLVSIFIHASVSFNSCDWNGGGQVGALSAIENRYFCLQGSGTTTPEKGGGKILTWYNKRSYRRPLYFLLLNYRISFSSSSLPYAPREW